MKVFVIGSSITSSYWNGAATYYRGIYRALAALGHEITFAEPDAYMRQQHRDGSDEDFCYVQSYVYRTPEDLFKMLYSASQAELVIKHSGVGVDDELLDRKVAGLRSPNTRVAFWDVDAPATLARVESDVSDPFRSLIPIYDFIFTYGGGPPVVEHYLRLGARNCFPIYNALDPTTHFEVEPQEQFHCDLAFVGNRMPDREQRVNDFFLSAARQAPEFTFLLGGEGWGDKTLPSNVRWIGHVVTADHNAINSSARMVLNINRDSMADVGFSPPTRVFEAAGAQSCLITDNWLGIEQFFTPGSEILVASSAEEIVSYLRNISRAEVSQIGTAMHERALRDHTYKLRAKQVHQILQVEQSEVIAA